MQTNTVSLHTGRQVPFAKAGSEYSSNFSDNKLNIPSAWANNASLGVEGPIIVDGGVILG